MYFRLPSPAFSPPMSDADALKTFKDGGSEENNRVSPFFLTTNSSPMSELESLNPQDGHAGTERTQIHRMFASNQTEYF
jgi:hypothetical protein